MARRVTSASSVSFADGREVCRYRHVICGVASKSRVSRKFQGRGGLTSSTTAMLAGATTALPARSAAIRDPVIRSLNADAVEFPVSDAAEKNKPLVRREPEDRPSGVPAVANADLATGQARHLDAVAVGVAQRALDPLRT